MVEISTDRFDGFVGAFLGAIFIGYIYGIIKLIIASQISIKRKYNSTAREKCLQYFFLDALTYEIVNYFDNNNPVAVNSLGNIARDVRL